jgi:hypothetical protein
MTNRLLRTSLTTAIITLVAGVAAASAAIDYGSPVSIGFGAHPVLRPALHLAVGSQDSGTKRFSAHGTFTIGKHTVAHLASFHGTATTSNTSITVKVSTLERHMIRAAARHYHAKRVSLTITTTVRPSRRPVRQIQRLPRDPEQLAMAPCRAGLFRGARYAVATGGRSTDGWRGPPPFVK